MAHAAHYTSGMIRLTRSKSQVVWILNARNIHSINLTINTFNLIYSGGECSGDHLTLSERNRTIGHYCGVRPPWWEISCSNSLHIELNIVSPDVQTVHAAYQVVTRHPGECRLYTFRHDTSDFGKYRINAPTTSGNTQYDIRWYIRTNIWNGIRLGVPYKTNIKVYHGQGNHEGLLALPEHVHGESAGYQLTGFHATVVISKGMGIHNDGFSVHVVYRIFRAEPQLASQHCTFYSKDNEFHLNVQSHYTQNSTGTITFKHHLFCLFKIQRKNPFKLVIDDVHFASNNSSDCADSGLAIYDEYQEHPDGFDPQLGPLCGHLMQQLLTKSPTNTIYTRGHTDYPDAGVRVRSVYVFFYSYSRDPSFLRATVYDRIVCAGLFQLCALSKDSEINKELSFKFLAGKTDVNYWNIQHGSKLKRAIFVELSSAGCIVLQQFPLLRQRSFVYCMIAVNSLPPLSTDSALDTHTEPFWFLRPIYGNMYFSHVNAASFCPYCRDIIVLFSANVGMLHVPAGEGNIAINESTLLYYFPGSIAKPSAFLLHLKSEIWLDLKPVPNVATHIGGESAQLNLSWTTGYYRLSFQRQLVIIYHSYRSCYFTKTFLFHSQGKNCQGSFVITNVLEHQPIYSWNFSTITEDNTLAWFARYTSSSTFLVNTGDVYLGQQYGCPMVLYFLYIPHYYVSSHEHVLNPNDKTCRVWVNNCQFGKCLRLALEHSSTFPQIALPTELLQASWEDVNNTCSKAGMSMPVLNSRDQTEWLRSLLNHRWNPDMFGYVIVYIGLLSKVMMLAVEL